MKNFEKDKAKNEARIVKVTKLKRKDSFCMLYFCNV